MSYTFQGSQAKAELWLPFAVAKQHMMKLNGIQRNTVMPDASTMIMISTNPPHIHIIVGSGQYYFTSRISEEELYSPGGAFIGRNDNRIYIKGDPKGKTSSEATKLEVHSPAARDLERHVWNGELYSVLGGYGKRYLVPAWPYDQIDGVGAREYALGVNAEVVKDGIVVYKAPFNSWNSFVNKGVVIDLGVTGDWKASVIGSDEISSSGSISVDSSHLAVDADFEQQPFYRPDDRVNASKLVFDSFTTTGGPVFVYWSINREGTRAMAVAQHIFNPLYLYVRQDGSSFDEDSYENRWPFNQVPVIVEIAIEVDEDKRVLITEVGRTKYGFAATPDSRLVFADYYYPETDTVAAHGDKVLGFISYLSASHVNPREAIYYEDSVTNFVTLSIKVGEEEIIRDTFRENKAYFYGTRDPDLPGYQDGYLCAIDLRYVSYAVWCRERTQDGANLGAPLYVTYKGKEVFNSVLAKGFGAHQTPENYSPLPPRSYVAPQGNIYGPFWRTGVLLEDAALAINHELDSVAFYANSNPDVGFELALDFHWRADLYIFLDKQTNKSDPFYNVIYDFHATASRALEPDEGQTKHCTASNWI